MPGISLKWHLSSLTAGELRKLFEKDGRVIHSIRVGVKRPLCKVKKGFESIWIEEEGPLNEALTMEEYVNNALSYAIEAPWEKGRKRDRRRQILLERIGEAVRLYVILENTNEKEYARKYEYHTIFYTAAPGFVYRRFTSALNSIEEDQ